MLFVFVLAAVSADFGGAGVFMFLHHALWMMGMCLCLWSSSPWRFAVLVAELVAVEALIDLHGDVWCVCAVLRPWCGSNAVVDSPRQSIVLVSRILLVFRLC